MINLFFRVYARFLLEYCFDADRLFDAATVCKIFIAISSLFTIIAWNSLHQTVFLATHLYLFPLTRKGEPVEPSLTSLDRADILRRDASCLMDPTARRLVLALADAAERLATRTDEAEDPDDVRETAVQSTASDQTDGPLAAIRAMCIQCTKGRLTFVRECAVTTCWLWPFRMGELPDASV